MMGELDNFLSQAKPIIKYIENCRSNGFSDEQIRKKLQESGYHLSVIDRLYSLLAEDTPKIAADRVTLADQKPRPPPRMDRVDNIYPFHSFGSMVSQVLFSIEAHIVSYFLILNPNDKS